ncbi:hypothetical protein DPMN_013520 [Dreissena polymorpha]|uniref:Uncharacterized protein n=1 Tax=Dreissena polymorpha TaxID=45954 RepID=A0A9D4N938_DREPO|nr:hypothetical protein DPMN_013520 [Dreissena polymorpha]
MKTLNTAVNVTFFYLIIFPRKRRRIVSKFSEYPFREIERRLAKQNTREQSGILEQYMTEFVDKHERLIPVMLQAWKE